MCGLKRTVRNLGVLNHDRYDKPLYVLPFDHRATFTKNMFGWEAADAGTNGGNLGREAGLLWQTVSQRTVPAFWSMRSSARP